jgi:hypothetical protein
MNITTTTKLDQQLVNLLETCAKINPETVTNQAQRKLNDLVKLTLQLPYLKRRHPNFSYQDYQEGLSEALGTLTVKNIRQFLQLLEQHNIAVNSENSRKIRQFYINRLNKISYYKTVDYLRRNSVFLSLDELVDQEQNQTFLDLIVDHNSSQLWEKMIEKESQQHFYRTISDQGLLNIYPNGYPKANLQAIIRLRLKEEKWSNIALQLQIPIGTLTSFWHRTGKSLLRKELA